MGSKHLYNIIFIAAHNYCVGRNRGVFGKLFLKGCLEYFVPINGVQHFIILAKKSHYKCLIGFSIHLRECCSLLSLMIVYFFKKLLWTVNAWQDPNNTSIQQTSTYLTYLPFSLILFKIGFKSPNSEEKKFQKRPWW